MTIHRFLIGPGWLVAAAIATTVATSPAAAQPGSRPRSYAPADSDRVAVQAVVDSALMFITAGNPIALTDLMVPQSQVSSVRIRDGKWVYAMRSRESDRARTGGAPVVERGFDTEIKVSGPVAIAWVPYDIYVNNAWSHCGVDVFTMVRDGPAWRIANLTYTVEQPPACRTHPAGPPPGMKAP